MTERHTTASDTADRAARFAGHAGTRLLALCDLGDPDARSIVLGDGANRLDIVVVRAGGEVVAYRNACPHAGTPLETFDGRFLDREDPDVLICSTHGARFRRRDGLCLSGPCPGRRLMPIPIIVADGDIRIAPASSPLPHSLPTKV